MHKNACLSLRGNKIILSMTRILFAFVLFLLFSACGGNKQEAPATQPDTTPAATTVADPDVQKGEALIAKNDCLTCHKIDEKLIGPTYREVARKYAGLPDTIVPYLAHKVMKGGTGTWGQIPMAAHPTLSEPDATALVKYVLAQK